MPLEKGPKNAANDPIEVISIKGSLGILAHGDLAIRAWREVKKTAKQNAPEKK